MGFLTTGFLDAIVYMLLSVRCCLMSSYTLITYKSNIVIMDPRDIIVWEDERSGEITKGIDQQSLGKPRPSCGPARNTDLTMTLREDRGLEERYTIYRI